MNFKILKKSKKSRARLGFIETAHGVIETPCFVPVATQAVVKTLTSEEVEKTNSQMLICNAFWLHLNGREKVIEKAGGLHKFMNFKKPLMTDSGGFQVFSLGFGEDLGMGKMLKEKSDAVIEHGRQPKRITITEDGVFFNSPLDGSPLFLGPKESMKIQERLGADIIFAFDECTSPVADHDYTRESIERTHRWAKVCLEAKKSKQAIFGIVQGGKFKDLRAKSATHIGAMGFDGFGIGGEFGDDKKLMPTMLNWVIKRLPERSPRHLLGIGHLDDIKKVIICGIDTFDCIAPTHYARRGIAFTSEGTLKMYQVKFLKKREPLDKGCTCQVCLHHTKDYICHLLRSKELTAFSLLTFHNVHYFNELVYHFRQRIKNNQV